MADFIMYCENENKQSQLGEILARQLPNASLGIFLYGDLGAGKTTLVRGILRGLGCKERVKSPTYSVMENYYLHEKHILHVDLYRLVHADEILAIGLIEQISLADLWIIEWPEKADGLLPLPDLSCYIAPWLNGRQIQMKPISLQGHVMVQAMEQAWDA